jgi:hypothetical protein
MKIKIEHGKTFASLRGLIIAPENAQHALVLSRGRLYHVTERGRRIVTLKESVRIFRQLFAFGSKHGLGDSGSDEARGRWLSRIERALH